MDNRMNVAKHICNIIEKGENGVLTYNLTSKIQEISSMWHPYFGIFQQIDLIVTNKYSLEYAFVLLSSSSADYLLNFVVMYFEEHCHFPSNGYISNYFPPRSQNSIWNNYSSYWAIFYTGIFNRISVYNSDIHIRAFVYILCFGEDSSYVPTSIIKAKNTKEVNSYVRTYVMADKKHLSEDLRLMIRSTLFRRCNIITDLGDILTEFCYVNEKTLGLFCLKKYKQLFVSKNILSNHLPSDAIELALSVFKYETLDGLQVLACLNSTYVLNYLKREKYFLICDTETRNIIMHRISYWLQKSPTLVLGHYFDSNIKTCPNAFLSLLCFFNTSPHVGRVLTFPFLSKIFTKRNFEYLIHEPSSLCNSCNSCDIINLMANILGPNKLIDDDFVLTMLYNGTYEKTKFSHKHSGIFVVCNTPGIIWYDFSEKYPHGNLPKSFLNYSKRRNSLRFKIIGLNCNTIRNRICIRHFLFKFGINDLHLKHIKLVNSKLSKDVSDKPFWALNIIIQRHKPCRPKFVLPLI